MLPQHARPHCKTLYLAWTSWEHAALQVPISAAMAVQLRSVAKHEEDERAEIKRLVLKANKDLDLAGSAGQ